MSRLERRIKKAQQRKCKHKFFHPKESPYFMICSKCDKPLAVGDCAFNAWMNPQTAGE